MNVVKKSKILCESVYVDTTWCKQLLSGLTKELKKRRISFDVVHSTDDVFLFDTVYAIGASEDWLKKIVEQCNILEVTPILLLPSEMKNVPGEYHEIHPDIHNAIKQLRDKIAMSGRNKVALYGVNKKVALDKSRVESFFCLVSQTEDIYSSAGGLEKCFRLFLSSAENYDTIICTNGYAAVSLVKKLEKENPTLLEKLLVITAEEVLKNSKYNQWISNIEFNLEQYGKVALQLNDMYVSGNKDASISVRVKCNVCEITPKYEKVLETGDIFIEPFEDPEIILMEKVEQLLQDADDLDHHIIAMLLDNAKYSDIADSCYMTEGNIKYRIKKYMAASGCTTKKELIELLQEYLS